MLDKTKRYLVVGLGLLGGKYALELTKAGFHVDGINRSEGHLQYALDHGYIASGKTHDFEDLVQQADHIIFGLYPTDNILCLFCLSIKKERESQSMKQNHLKIRTALYFVGLFVMTIGIALSVKSNLGV